MKNRKLRSINISIIAGLLAMSFNVSADDGDAVEMVINQPSTEEIKQLNSVDELKKIEKELEIVSRQNLNASLQKSQYRNEISELALREQLLARQISVRNRILELRRLDYMMDLPIEAHIDTSQFNLPDDKDVKIPKIDDHSLSLREYKPSTFQADQIIFRERNNTDSDKKNNESDGQDLSHSQQGGLNANQRRDSLPQEVERVSTITNERITPPSAPVREINIPQLNRPTPPQNQLTESMDEDGLSDAELAVLGISREEYQRWISQDLSLDAENAEIDDNLGASVKELVDTIEIVKVKVNNIFIFGENRRANISIEYEMSDGMTSEREVVDYRSLEQGDIINYNGYRMKVNRITRTDVEIINEDINSRHIGTSTYR